MMLQGYGTVRFSSKEEAEKAIEDFNGTELEGRALAVKIDKCVSCPCKVHLRWSVVWLLSSLEMAEAFVPCLSSCIFARPCDFNHEPLRPCQLRIRSKLLGHKRVLVTIKNAAQGSNVP